MDVLSTPNRLTEEHWRPAFSPSCMEFVHPGGWRIDNGSTSKIRDVPIEIFLAYRILASAPVPLGFRVLELIGTWLGVGPALGVWE